jgi:hypothetical protein
VLDAVLVENTGKINKDHQTIGERQDNNGREKSKVVVASNERCNKGSRK